MNVFQVSAVQKRLKMALDRQKEAAEKKSMIQQQQQKQAEGLVPRMKVSPSSTDVFNLPMTALKLLLRL